MVLVFDGSFLQFQLDGFLQKRQMQTDGLDESPVHFGRNGRGNFFCQAQKKFTKPRIFAETVRQFCRKVRQAVKEVIVVDDLMMTK